MFLIYACKCCLKIKSGNRYDSTLQMTSHLLRPDHIVGGFKENGKATLKTLCMTILYV